MQHGQRAKSDTGSKKTKGKEEKEKKKEGRGCLSKGKRKDQMVLLGDKEGQRPECTIQHKSNAGQGHMRKPVTNY